MQGVFCWVRETRPSDAKMLGILGTGAVKQRLSNDAIKDRTEHGRQGKTRMYGTG